MRSAYLRWQDDENRLIEARQRLARQYLITLRQAEQVQIKAHLGILRAARLLLDQPLDAAIVMMKDHVQKAFALLGQGYFRRLPSPLEVELGDYAARIGKLCRNHAELEGRLRLAQGIIKIFARSPEFCHLRFFRLAFISPESAWLLLQIRNQRRQQQQEIQDCLAANCQMQIQ
jgi:hypothetical protein